jgi:phytoene/squalene synthetase
MSLDACAALVARGDPGRFRAMLMAPPAVRGALAVLYAFNLEVARAPWAAAEPLIAEMRLQWWRDVVAEAAAGGARRAHEVAGPLWDLIRDRGLPAAPLDALVGARRWDVWREPFADAAARRAYLEATAGGLMVLAAQATGGQGGPAARDAGFAQGAAAFLAAVADLRARGRDPLPDAAVAALVREGQDRLAAARAGRAAIGPAGLAAWETGPLLARARRAPGRVAAGTLRGAEAASRARAAWVALTGRW